MAKKSKNIFHVFVEGRTYLNVVLMMLLFPLGIISFIVAITLLVFSLGLISAPIFAPLGPINFGAFQINSLPIKLLVALVFTLIGIFFLTASLHVINALSSVYKKILGVFD